MAADFRRFRDRPVPHRQLPDEVAAYVREMILSGQVLPGEFLRMEPIAEAVQVSNTPVREGLLALRSEGLVDLVPRKGFVVSPVSEQDIRDLFWTQAQLAAELAARAARQIIPQQVTKLEAINAEFDKAVAAGDQERTARLGHEFHREINLAADSRRLTVLLGSVVKQLPNRFYASIEGQIAATRNDHPALVDALRKGNERRARCLAEKHLLDGAAGVVKVFKDRGLWADQVTAS